jgi:hypothetical protein
LALAAVEKSARETGLNVRALRRVESEGEILRASSSDALRMTVGGLKSKNESEN